MAGSQDIEKMMAARSVSCGKLIHFGFKSSVFQLPLDDDSFDVYPIRISASGTNHLNLLVVSESECVRLEPQKYAHLMYKAARLDSLVRDWSRRRGIAYRVITGNDKTYRNCVVECFNMLDSLIENRD